MVGWTGGLWAWSQCVTDWATREHIEYGTFYMYQYMYKDRKYALRTLGIEFHRNSQQAFAYIFHFVRWLTIIIIIINHCYRIRDVTVLAIFIQAILKLIHDIDRVYLSLCNYQIFQFVWIAPLPPQPLILFYIQKFAMIRQSEFFSIKKCMQFIFSMRKQYPLSLSLSLSLSLTHSRW